MNSRFNRSGKDRINDEPIWNQKLDKKRVGMGDFLKDRDQNLNKHLEIIQYNFEDKQRFNQRKNKVDNKPDSKTDSNKEVKIKDDIQKKIEDCDKILKSMKLTNQSIMTENSKKLTLEKQQFKKYLSKDENKKLDREISNYKYINTKARSQLFKAMCNFNPNLHYMNLIFLCQADERIKKDIIYSDTKLDMQLNETLDKNYYAKKYEQIVTARKNKNTINERTTQTGFPKITNHMSTKNTENTGYDKKLRIKSKLNYDKKRKRNYTNRFDCDKYEEIIEGVMKEMNDKNIVDCMENIKNNPGSSAITLPTEINYEKYFPETKKLENELKNDYIMKYLKKEEMITETKINPDDINSYVKDEILNNKHYLLKKVKDANILNPSN